SCIAWGCCSHSLVLLSISVNRNVTVPVGDALIGDIITLITMSKCERETSVSLFCHYGNQHQAYSWLSDICGGSCEEPAVSISSTLARASSSFCCWAARLWRRCLYWALARLRSIIR